MQRLLAPRQALLPLQAACPSCCQPHSIHHPSVASLQPRARAGAGCWTERRRFCTSLPRLPASHPVPRACPPLPCSPEHVQLLVLDRTPLFFSMRDGPWFPTLRLLHQVLPADWVAACLTALGEVLVECFLLTGWPLVDCKVKGWLVGWLLSLFARCSGPGGG